MIVATFNSPSNSNAKPNPTHTWKNSHEPVKIQRKDKTPTRPSGINRSRIEARKHGKTVIESADASGCKTPTRSNYKTKGNAKADISGEKTSKKTDIDPE